MVENSIKEFILKLWNHYFQTKVINCNKKEVEFDILKNTFKIIKYVFDM